MLELKHFQSSRPSFFTALRMTQGTRATIQEQYADFCSLCRAKLLEADAKNSATVSCRTTILDGVGIGMGETSEIILLNLIGQGDII